MSIFGSILDKIFRHGQPSASGDREPCGFTIGAKHRGTGDRSGSIGNVCVGKTERCRRRSRADEARKFEGRRRKLAHVNRRPPETAGVGSSLGARKSLAQELNVHAGADGSAEQNIALQKAVMQKLAENGGKVPDSLRH